MSLDIAAFRLGSSNKSRSVNFGVDSFSSKKRLSLDGSFPRIRSILLERGGLLSFAAIMINVVSCFEGSELPAETQSARQNLRPFYPFQQSLIDMFHTTCIREALRYCSSCASVSLHLLEGGLHLGAWRARRHFSHETGLNS